MAKAKFNIGAFIQGVERPTHTVELCMDRETRERIDGIMNALSLLQDDDEGISGDTGRQRLLAELKTIQDDPDVWTEIVVRAPSHATKAAFQVALSSEDGSPDLTGRILAAEASMLKGCVVSIAGTPVELSDEDVAHMLDAWPDELTAELIEAINDLGAGGPSIPLSQRLSETLTTPDPSDS